MVMAFGRGLLYLLTAAVCASILPFSLAMEVTITQTHLSLCLGKKPGLWTPPPAAALLALVELGWKGRGKELLVLRGPRSFLRLA